MSGHNQNFIRLNYQSFYDAIMKDGDIKKIVKELTTKVPACENELKAFLSHIYNVEKQYSSNFITNEKYNTYLSRITAATIHFLDELSKGDTDSACQHLEIGEEKPSAFTAVIQDQLDYGQQAVKENKRFKTAVAVMFLVAICFSLIVSFNHIDFLKEEKYIGALLGLNVVLYVCIGVLSLYALTLIIRGIQNNQRSLSLSRNILK